MALPDDIHRLMDLYPAIFFACHTRHVPDPKTSTLLSWHQASILDHLDDREGTALTVLAAHLGVTPSTMSLAVDRLQRHGYVARRRDPADGRRVLVCLTRAGLRIREAKTVLDPGLVRSMLGSLSERKRRAALNGLTILAEAAGRRRRPGVSRLRKVATP